MPVGCAAFLLGVGFLFALGPTIFASALSVCFALGAVKKWRWLAVVCLAALVLASGRQQLFFQHRQRMVIQAEAQNQPLTAHVLAAFSKDIGKQRVILRGEAGNFQADLNSYRAFSPGDRVEFTCKWSQPEAIEDFRYDYYLASKGVYVLCDPKSWQRTGSERFLRHPLLISRKWLLNAIAELWPAPARSLIAGLLIGNRESFSKQQLEHFSRAGITHIIALSGTNIVILISFFEWLAVRARIRSGFRVWLVVGTIVLFVLFVGAPSSVVRAAIMGSIAYVGSYMGRPANALRLLLCCAAVMVLINPLLLLYDAGFQLSFLSTMGVIWLLPLFEKLVSRLPDLLAESLAMTLAASLATAPLLLYQFGALSLIAPLTNIVILPLIPYIMAASAAAVLMEVAHLPLVNLIVYVTQLACNYIFSVSSFASGFQKIMLVWEMPFLLLVASYILLTVLMSYVARNLKTDR